MSDRLLLIASDDDFQELAAFGGLPESLLKSVSPDKLLSSLEAEPPWIVASPPEDVLRDEQDAQARREAARLCNSLIDRTVCTLVVIGEEEPARDEVSEADDEAHATSNEAENVTEENSAIRTPGDVRHGGDIRHVSPLAAHADWQRKFRERMRRHDPTRAMHVRHVLVLVCLRPLRDDEMVHFEQLVTGDSENKLFDLAYVMLDELEPGGDAGQLFYAAEAWPIAVGNLLLKLLHDPDRPVIGPTLSMAWRSWRLSPRLVTASEGPLEQSLFAQLVLRLTADHSPDRGWDPHQLSKISPPARHEAEDELKRPQSDKSWSDGAWEEYRAARHVVAVASAERWEKPLAAAGGALSAELSSALLEQEPAANVEVAKVWQSIHRHPRYVYAALAACEALERPSTDEQFDEIAQRWNTAIKHEADRDAKIDTAHGCARHLELAQHGFLPLWKRAIAGGVVAAVLLLVASTCLGGILNHWGVASTVMVFVLVGAGGAAWGSDYLERRAGRRGRENIGEQLQQIDEQVLHRHRACRAAVLSAQRFWQHLRVRAAVGRLKATVSRLRRILDLELRDPAAQVAMDGSSARERSAAPDQRRDTQIVHRRRYEECISLTRDIDAEALTEHGDDLDQLVAEQTEAFLHQFWAPFCEKHDPLRTGHLPARQLIPALRRFCATFHQIAAARTTIIAIDRLTDDDMATWGRGLRQRLAYQEYFELASCRLLARNTADENDRPAPTLILRRGLNYGPLITHLEGTTVRRLENDTDWLDALPLVGLLHQELPVRFEGRDGRIVVGDYQ